MPEARDRLSRAEDVTASYRRRRRLVGRVGNVERGSSVSFILEDEPEDAQRSRTPFRWRDTAMMGTAGLGGVADFVGRSDGGSVGRGDLGTPRIWRGRNLYASPVSRRENLTPGAGSSRGRGYGGRGGSRGRGSVLPSWYPRTPLRDITAVVRAIERRRDGLRAGVGQILERPILQDQALQDPPLSTSGAQLEHDISMISPNPTIGIRRCPPSIGKVPKILLDITNKNNGESAILTPQKKLLNSIDTVEKVVMEELRKLKRTPTAKKAEREKRVRTLMSMR